MEDNKIEKTVEMEAETSAKVESTAPEMTSGEAVPDKVEAAAEVLPDKESKATETKEATTSKGEYADVASNYLKGLNPGLEINDDNYVSTMEQTLAEKIMPRMQAYDEANTNLRAMMHGNPKLGKVLADMAKGARFEEALPRYYDVSGFKLEPGDPDYTKWEAANKQRMTEYQASLDRETQMENNRKKSEEVISSWFSEKGLDDKGKEEYGSFVSDLLERAYAGEITPEFLNKLYYAMTYQDDLAKAQKAGEIKAKNEKIAMETLKEDTALKGDKLPVIDGGAAKEKVEPKPDNANPLVQGLRSMGQKKTVLPGNY